MCLYESEINKSFEVYILPDFELAGTFKIRDLRQILRGRINAHLAIQNRDLELEAEVTFEARMRKRSLQIVSKQARLGTGDHNFAKQFKQNQAICY
jgi:hypothetical protein